MRGSLSPDSWLVKRARKPDGRGDRRRRRRRGGRLRADAPRRRGRRCSRPSTSSALRRSGTNSGILHTGLRLAARRARDPADPALGASCAIRCSSALGVPVLRCGALLRPATRARRERSRRSPRPRARNGVEVELARRRRARGPGRGGDRPGRLHARAGGRGGGRAAPSCAPARASRRSSATATGSRCRLADGERRRLPASRSTAPACTPTRSRGWRATTSFAIYPRKGEFFVFEPPGRRAARADPAAGADQADQGRARVSDRRRQGDRRPDRPRPGRQGRLDGARGGAGTR